MLPTRDTFIAEDFEGIGVCGCYVPSRDSAHVGLFWKFEGKNQVVHFWNTNDIRIGEINATEFSTYYFNKIENFKNELIYSLKPLLEFIIRNKTNTLVIKVENVIYKDGKFNLSDGNYLIDDECEKFINCGVFVLAILNSFGYKLININDWPIVTAATKRQYLEDWLNSKNIVGAEREKYYQSNREIRGKHVLSAPSTTIKPSDYLETETLSTTLIAFLNAEYTKTNTPPPQPTI